MAQEGEKKEKLNLHIHLTGNKYLVGDGMSCWIVRETKGIVKTGKHKGEETLRRVKLSGYHNDPEQLIDSYRKKSVLSAELDGELADLAKLFRKIHKETKGWKDEILKALEGDD